MAGKPKYPKIRIEMCIRDSVKVALNDGTFDVREYPFRELRVKNASSRPKLPDEEDTSVSTVEADALPLEAETALPSIAFGDDAPASELKKAPKKQQKRRAPTNGQKEPKERFAAYEMCIRDSRCITKFPAPCRKPSAIMLQQVRHAFICPAIKGRA